MEIEGWTYREVEAPQQFVREFCKAVAIVARLDGATWGYTIWTNGACLEGHADWNWTPEDAAAEAEKVLLTLHD